jgi:hypothetical protein
MLHFSEDGHGPRLFQGEVVKKYALEHAVTWKALKAKNPGLGKDLVETVIDSRHYHENILSLVKKFNTISSDRRLSVKEAVAFELTCVKEQIFIAIINPMDNRFRYPEHGVYDSKEDMAKALDGKNPKHRELIRKAIQRGEKKAQESLRKNVDGFLAWVKKNRKR